MASLTKKVIHGRPYYYLRETARVGGKPKVVRTVYLGRAEDILARLEQRSEPLRAESRSFGAAAGAVQGGPALAVAGGGGPPPAPPRALRPGPGAPRLRHDQLRPLHRLRHPPQHDRPPRPPQA